jgi:hypothetical protein
LLFILCFFGLVVDVLVGGSLPPVGYKNGTQRWGPLPAEVWKLDLMLLFENHQSRPCCKRNFVPLTPLSPLVPFL